MEGYKDIGEYGVIGNGVTVALVSRDGGIDWMCLPFLDSPSVFAAILDHEKGGTFSICPVEPWDSVQSYFFRTNILQTLFRTTCGEVELIDFMPVGPSMAEHPLRESGLLRRIKALRGKLKLRIRCAPRFDYGRLSPEWINLEPGRWSVRAGDQELTVWSSRELEWNEERSLVELEEGEQIWLSTVYGRPETILSEKLAGKFLEETRVYWEEWTRGPELGKYPRFGVWQENVDRAALVLKLLQIRKTGAIAAAATTSLPAIVGGERNWDYRYMWIRDTSMTLGVLFDLGHVTEVFSYFEYLKELVRRGEERRLSVMYCLMAPNLPEAETVVEQLSGYKGSSPVHIGQYNIQQIQHDIYGELLDLIFTVSRCIGKLDWETWELARTLVEEVIPVWREKDHGIWELRTGPHHNTHSKLMAWVALDRGIQIAAHYGLPADLDRWRAERDAIREDILEHGYSKTSGHFRQHYGTEAVDAALLRIPLVDFLPVDDPRVARTIQAIERDLKVDGVILRYRTPDGLPGQEHGFLICLFWYLRCLIRQNRLDEVEAYLRNIDQFHNPLCLFGEQYDPRFKQILGNYPQAFSHIGYTRTLLDFFNARRERRKTARGSRSWQDQIQLLILPRNLSPDLHEGKQLDKEEAWKELMQLLNVLRGQYHDGHRRRLNYENIWASEDYSDFQEVVGRLRIVDLSAFTTEEEKIAFWLNTYNILIIYAVIALRIQKSVKEVPFFFERVQYVVGGQRFSLNDIEHGILRANAFPPGRWRKCFRPTDTRLRFSVKGAHPEVHFGLVRATRTCPPLDVYEPDLVWDQLKSSAQAFVNSTTRMDQDRKQLFVSELFHLYHADFEEEDASLIRYISQYCYDRDQGEWLRKHAPEIRLSYIPYDWRLNDME